MAEVLTFRGDVSATLDRLERERTITRMSSNLTPIDGRWEAQFRGPDGTRYYGMGSTNLEAWAQALGTLLPDAG